MLITSTTSAVLYRLLFTSTASGSNATFLNVNAGASPLTYNASTLVLTNTGGNITCASVTATGAGTNLTGTATAATQITLTANSALTTARYLLFSDAAGANKNVNITDTTPLPLTFVPSSATLTVGNASTGGSITTTTVNCTNLTGLASQAMQVNITTTASTSTRYLVFASAVGQQALSINTAATTLISCNPSVPSITMGAGVPGLGVITSNSFIGELTGNASSATQVSTVAVTSNSARYLVFTPSNNGSAAAATMQTA